MRFPHWVRCLLLAVASLDWVASLAAQQPYKLLASWTIGGQGSWDYLTVDGAAHRLYLAHNSRIEVVDTTTGKLVGAVTGLHSTHGVALGPDGRFGYISDGAGNAVAVFDRATLATVTTIAVGANPDGILYEPATATVWAFDGKSREASVIDTATNKVIATVPLPGKPETPVADGAGTLYVPLEDKGQVVRLDARRHAVTASWPIGCDAPTGLALDTVGRRLFAACDGNKMAVLDTRSGAQLAHPAIGDGPDAAGFSASRQLAFASSGDGVLAVVDTQAAAYPTLQKLATQRYARTMAYDALADRIYVTTADMGPRPAPTAENPKPRAAAVPGSFRVLVIGRE